MQDGGCHRAVVVKICFILPAPNLRVYFQQDANWNTTVVVGFNSTTCTWQITQRYVYSTYGIITVLNADWSTPPAGTTLMVNNLYQGMSYDAVTGLYYERARWYSPSLGTWISQDPLQYINGADTYQFVVGNPIIGTDPTGLTMVAEPPPAPAPTIPLPGTIPAPVEVPPEALGGLTLAGLGQLVLDWWQAYNNATVGQVQETLANAQAAENDLARQRMALIKRANGLRIVIRIKRAAERPKLAAIARRQTLMLLGTSRRAGRWWPRREEMKDH